MWAVRLPTVKVCEGHTAPFDAFAEGYFGNQSNYSLWYGSRGSGKSYMLALLALTKAATLDIDVTLLGGSMAQSQNVHEHVETLLKAPNAPLYAINRVIATEVEFVAGNWIRPLPASQKTVRGPHPQLTLLDEIDEMDRSIYDAALPQAMEKPNARGFPVREMIVASSTWQRPIGTFSEVYNEAILKGLPIRTWCYRELLQTPSNPSGWMAPGFIERKKQSLPAELFRVEYDLGEPSGTARAIDLNALERCLTGTVPIRSTEKIDDLLQVYEDPDMGAIYATGADWAKEEDWTVITTWRLDEYPYRLVNLRMMRRRPWPQMIAAFNDITKRYFGTSAHDATGIGNVVGDLIDERTIKMVMVGRDRITMLTEYIAAVESGHYAIPRAAKRFVMEHKAATVDDIYSTTVVTGSHLPDSVASAALAHRAATRGAMPGMAQPVPKDKMRPLSDEIREPMPKWLEDMDQIPPPPKEEILSGYVVEREEPEDTAIFWLPS